MASTADDVADLVIVACHAIFLGNPGSSECDVYSPQQWHLQSFQKPTGCLPGEHETFLLHIQAGLNALVYGSVSRSSVLVFSGAATAQDVTGLSEAQSYFDAAVALTQQFGRGHPFTECLKSRTLVEDAATDSYQNLLFSILKFRRHFGRYPRSVRVITHAFKTERFLDLHANAIRWPSDRIHVQGIDPVSRAADHAQNADGESKRGLSAWTQDLYGMHAPLMDKRIARGWQKSALLDLGQGLEDDVKALLAYDGGKDGTALFEGPLPW
ncbi:uncharacterized protein IWZ02DRAFT_154090 [Phyllosticta citriasiana]|uniref:DUF218 domain-containing protein n=1 Tax=Phyllosticta citriasiana TaxID=595635 RepID=A0ABR1KW92_9PEZI